MLFEAAVDVACRDKPPRRSRLPQVNAARLDSGRLDRSAGALSVSRRAGRATPSGSGFPRISRPVREPWFGALTPMPDYATFEMEIGGRVFATAMLDHRPVPGY